MGKLTNDEIKEIIKRASILQKFHEQPIGSDRSSSPKQDDPVFEIGESLNIKRHFIQEALLEYEGISIEEPVMIDNYSDTEVEVLGYANGNIDGSLMKELKAHLEYHFNTVGNVSRRKGNIYWKASPSFPARLFTTTRSPELEIKEQKGRVKLTMRQNLKTLNKLYVPPLAFTLGGIMMFAAVIFDAVGNDGAPPMLIMSGIFLAGSFGFARFVKGLKKRRKRKLIDLVETLQQIMERRFRAGKYKEEKKPEIDLAEFQDEIELQEIEIREDSRIKS